MITENHIRGIYRETYVGHTSNIRCAEARNMMSVFVVCCRHSRGRGQVLGQETWTTKCNERSRCKNFILFYIPITHSIYSLILQCFIFHSAINNRIARVNIFTSKFPQKKCWILFSKMSVVVYPSVSRRTGATAPCTIHTMLWVSDAASASTSSCSVVSILRPLSFFSLLTPSAQSLWLVLIKGLDRR